MMRFFASLAVLMLLAGVAVAQEFTAQNQIGLYVSETPATHDDASTLATSGLIQVYLVINNPYNPNVNFVGNPPVEVPPHDIVNMGGYELTLNFPGAWNIFGEVTTPPNTVNLSSLGYPEFFVTGTFPTSGGTFTTLAAFQIANFTDDPGNVFMVPISAPSITDGIAITDADYDFQLIQAYPANGSEDFSAPIFGIGLPVVDSEEVSWGEVKSLYR